MNSPSRRRALRIVALAAALPALAPRTLARMLAAPSGEDDPDARALFRWAEERGLRDAPMGEIVIAVAGEFLGHPYAARTLEGGDEERLVVNLREFDCVTLVESVLALARCIAAGAPTADALRGELTRIRYRDGILDGYSSRLHYFTDWIADNARKGVVEDVTVALGGKPLTKRIDFMTAHPDLYPRLRNDAVRAAIAERERALSRREYAVIPAPKAGDGRGIRDGDIIGIATSRGGLDIDHTGFAVRVAGRLRLLEASSAAGAVRIGDRSVQDVLRSRAVYTGLVVARPLHPARG